jgi:hypothetical protein
LAPAATPAALAETGEEGKTVRLPSFAIPVATLPAGDRVRPLPNAEEVLPAPLVPMQAPVVAADDATGYPLEPGEEEETPAEAPEAEPPPFPRGELPAFADGPQEEVPVWTVNPQTGEKVHEGPIELTFDGSLAPARSGRPNARLVLAAVLSLVVVAALAVSFYMRSRGGDSPEPSRDAVAEPPVVTAPAGTAPAPDEAQALDSPAPPPAAAGGTTLEAPASPAGEAPGIPADQGAAGAPAVVRAPPPESAGSGDPRLAPGQALLDAGDLAGAAAAFRAVLAALPADRVTLQLMIACEEATVRKARAALSPDDPIFVTAFTLQGRPCHRLLWGIYPDRDAAKSGSAALPPYFTGAGVTPVPIPVGRLRGPS